MTKIKITEEEMLKILNGKNEMKNEIKTEGGKMKNTIADLHNNLFEQLERLNDTELKGDDLKEEMERAKMIANVATQIINADNLMLKASQHFNSPQVRISQILGITGNSNENT